MCCVGIETTKAFTEVDLQPNDKQIFESQDKFQIYRKIQWKYLGLYQHFGWVWFILSDFPVLSFISEFWQQQILHIIWFVNRMHVTLQSNWGLGYKNTAVCGFIHIFD